jgi:N-glycosylase/DNA lyase
MPPAWTPLGPGSSRDLRAAVLSHGWSQLAPFEARVDTLSIRLRGGPVRVFARGRELWAEGARDPVAIRACLSLELDLEPFWRICRDDADLNWASRARAGRVLRAPTAFADAAMVLATTNCSWSLTKRIVSALCEHWGEDGAFPDQAALADVSEADLKEYGRLGYRAPFLRKLAQRDLESLRHDDRPTEEIYRDLLALPGFGPYAAEGMLRLLHRFEHFALDSWVVPRYGELFPRRRCTETALCRRFARYGTWRGLAFWLTVTADWYR